MDLGISEGLGKVGNFLRGSIVGNAALAASRKLTSTKNWPVLVNTAQASGVPKMLPGESFAQASQRTNATLPTPPKATTPPKKNLGANAKAISTKNSKVTDSIGRDWNDQDDLLKNAGKSVAGLDTLKGSLGAARDTLLQSYDNQYGKKKEQIAGNKELIVKNQGSTLKDQADALRKSIFNSNLVLGGGMSSASGAAARALAASMGKNRQNILTQAGDQISEENQNEVNATDEHEMMRKAAYDWEEKQKNELIAQFKVTDAALKRLRNKVPDWKQADIDNESESHLQNFLQGLNEINATAKNYRDYINGILTGKYNEAQAVDAAAIGIDTPAALDTPTFNDSVVLPNDGSGAQVDETATDFYNPANTPKKRVNTDIFGNPLTFDEAMAA